MTKRLRRDYPGCLHHVCNRAIGRRPAFENRADTRLFLAFLARSIRRTSIELLAYAILTTHFHLMVRSPLGNLSEAMRYLESCYTRRFNLRHGRDGALFKGRFWSRPLGDFTDQLSVLRYIDYNPIEAGLVHHPSDYPWCSASHYAAPSGPVWLARAWVEHLVAAENPTKSYDPIRYRAWCLGGSTGARWVAQRRASMRTSFHVSFDNLIGRPGSRLREWLQWNAKLADGTSLTECVIDPASLRAAVAELRPAHSDPEFWRTIEFGLMRAACGMSLGEIGQARQTARTTVIRHLGRYREFVWNDAEFAAAAADTLALALKTTHGAAIVDCATT